MDKNRTSQACNCRQQERRDSVNLSNCKALKTRFQQIEFAITETVLYLDAYPDCVDALNYYHQLVDEREQLLSAINNQCGPMTHFGVVSDTNWQWVNEPWPWKYEAN